MAHGFMSGQIIIIMCDKPMFHEKTNSSEFFPSFYSFFSFFWHPSERVLISQDSHCFYLYYDCCPYCPHVSDEVGMDALVGGGLSEVAETTGATGGAEVAVWRSFRLGRFLFLHTYINEPIVERAFHA